MTATPEQRAEWKAAKAELEAVEDEREALLAPIKARLLAATDRFDLADEAAEHVGDCEGCAEPIFAGDRYHYGSEHPLCEECAPSYQDMLDEPFLFAGPDDEPMSEGDARARFAAHVAAGGTATDKMVSA